MNEHDEPVLLPKGAEDFTPATDAEIDALAEVTPERIGDAKAWLKRKLPDLAKELDGEGT